MEKRLFDKLSCISTTLFDSLVGIFQVCDKDETDEYFKDFLILVFRDRKPHTIYGIKDKSLNELLEDISFLLRYHSEEKEVN